jgi:hypothetical protein
MTKKYSVPNTRPKSEQEPQPNHGSQRRDLQDDGEPGASRGIRGHQAGNTTGYERSKDSRLRRSAMDVNNS